MLLVLVVPKLSPGGEKVLPELSFAIVGPHATDCDCGGGGGGGGQGYVVKKDKAGEMTQARLLLLSW